MNMKQSCKALICAIEGELDGRHCTEEQAAAILDHALPSLTEALARVEAERDTAIAQMQNIRKERDRINKELGDTEFNLCIAQQQLADVLYILDQHRTWTGMGWEQLPLPVHAVEKIRSKLAKAEQQEAREAKPPLISTILNGAFDTSHLEAQGAQAGEFQREDRYIVIKRKDLEKAPTLMAYALQVALDGLREYLPERECLVIEGDWPEFEPTWAAIQARVEGRAALATQPAVPDAVDQFFEQVKAELRHARAKFPGDRIMTLALAEEFGELCKAVLDERAAAVRKEAVQVACMAARVVLDGDGSVVDWRRERGLDPLLADAAMRAQGDGGEV